MDPIQFVLLLSISLITIVLIAVGYWVIQILRELKITVIKTNQILDDTKLITTSVAQPVSSFAEFFSGLKTGLSVFNAFLNKK
jgi:hypothetical protein